MKKPVSAYADLNINQKEVIGVALDDFVTRTSEELSVSREAVSAVAFYRLQRHPLWGRNATTTQKNASYNHWKGICYRCSEIVPRSEAKFHHLNRGIRDQHQPANLVPEHTSCHDDEHNVLEGSLSKGSPRPTKKK